MVAYPRPTRPSQTRWTAERTPPFARRVAGTNGCLPGRVAVGGDFGVAVLDPRHAPAPGRHASNPPPSGCPMGSRSAAPAAAPWDLVPPPAAAVPAAFTRAPPSMAHFLLPLRSDPFAPPAAPPPSSSSSSSIRPL